MEENMVGIPEREAKDQSFLRLWWTWAGMLATPFILVFLCHQYANELRTAGPDFQLEAIRDPDFPLELTRNILYGVSVLTLILTHFLRKHMVPGRVGGTEPMSLKPSSLSNPPSLLTKYAVATVVSLMLSEAIGILGFIMFMIGGDFQVLYTFIAISAIAMFIYRPKKEELERMAVALQTKEASAPAF
jgi:hypothetical protein